MKHLSTGDKINTPYGKMGIVSFKDNTDQGWFDVAHTTLLQQEPETDDKVDVGDIVVINTDKYKVVDIECQLYKPKGHLELYPKEELDNAN
jgi:hypothetical protein